MTEDNHTSGRGDHPDRGNPLGGKRITRKEFIAGAALTGTGLVVWSGLRTESGLGALERAGLASSDMIEMTLRINGGEYPLSIEPRVSLLDALRERTGLTGTKKGCNQGACGACTVHADGRRINSCLTLAAMYDEVEITTIEGLASGDRLHPVQAAFIENDGFQCGACTSGQIMSAVALIEEGHAGSDDEIREWMSGNICRCGAYPGIVAAVRSASGREA